MKKNFLHKVLSFLINKYFLVFMGFMVWIIVFDPHNLIDRSDMKKRLRSLKQDTLYYHDKINRDQELIKQLKTSPQNLERFAREQFLMKAPDEDVFVIVKKEPVR